MEANLEDVLRKTPSHHSDKRNSEPPKGSSQAYPDGVKNKKRQSEPVQVHKIILDKTKVHVALLKLHLDEIEPLIKVLNSRLSNRGDLNPYDIFNQWSVEQADSEYPLIGARPHAVPNYFIGQHCTAPIKLPPLDARDTQATVPDDKNKTKTTGEVSSERKCEGEKAKVNLSSCPMNFQETREQQSQFRGDTGQRTVGRAFRMLNKAMEDRGESTMFIISQLHYDNLLTLLRKQKEGFKNAKVKATLKEFADKYPKVFEPLPVSYLNMPDKLENRGELDLMVLHPDKGVIFVQIKSLMNEKELSLAAKRENNAALYDPSKTIKKIHEAEEQLERDISIFNCLMSRSRPCGEGQRSRSSETAGQESTVSEDSAKSTACAAQLASSSLESGAEGPLSCGEDRTSSCDQGQGSSPCSQQSRLCAQDGVVRVELAILVTRVIALPNLTEQDLTDAGVQKKQGIKYLLKEDLFKDDVRVPESETDLTSFKAWWHSVPSLDTPLDLTLIKEIVGKYIGPLSSALTCKGGNERERLRHFRDCILRTGRLLKRPVLNARQKQIMEETTSARLVYLSGPPGSGKTLLLALRALRFLEDPSKHVIVLNKYRGAHGRAIGERISEAIKGGNDDERVHLVPEDVSENTFDKQQFLRAVNNLRKHHGFKVEDLLFLVDEIYVESFWQDILDTFDGEFSTSVVWCAGLFSEAPKGFTEQSLDEVLRCTPSVQNLLYHVDWKPKRKEKYVRDTVQSEVPTNGPTPLCIRHERHVQLSVTECAQCATQLARLLTEEKIVRVAEPSGERQEVIAESGGEGQAAAASSSAEDTSIVCCSDIKVTILVNMPRKLYRKRGKYIDTSLKRYEAYMKYVEQCPFIQTLRNNGVAVVVKTELACKGLGTDEQEACIATWIYNFQGLETDVVVVLPGDTPRGREEVDPTARAATGTAKSSGGCAREGGELGSSPSRAQPPAQIDCVETETDIPAPGLSREDFEDDGDALVEQIIVCVCEALCSDSSCINTCSDLKESFCPARGHVHAQDHSGGAGQDSASGSRPSSETLTSMQWNLRDISRCSSWDRTNIMVAASRSLALVILIVP